jgi:alpha-glucoside transport system substrate-binding protein
MTSRKRWCGGPCALAAILLAAGGLSACTGADQPGSVTILAPWADDRQFDANAADEADAFKKVLARFAEDTGIRVTYQGTRDVSEVLRSSVRRGSPPDVAVLPRLNDLMRHAREGKVLPLDAADHRDAQPSQLVQFDVGEGTTVYGVSITTRVKSLIWYNPDRISSPAPATWKELTGLVEAIDQEHPAAVPWCMGMASPPLSGWPGTDWIEDILLHQAGTRTYEKWAAGQVPWTDPVVRDAWREWHRIAPPDRRTDTALLTSFWDAGLAMFDDPPSCYLDHQASFVYGSYRASWESGPSPRRQSRVSFFPFPTDESRLGDTGRLLEVSDNVAAVFNRDSPSARKLVNYLTSREAQKIWREASDDQLFALRDDTDRSDYADEVGRKIAETLTTSTVCRDASDLMPTPMTTAFQRAALEYLHQPERLDELLAELEKVRAGLPVDDWLDLRCVGVGPTQ